MHVQAPNINLDPTRALVVKLKMLLSRVMRVEDELGELVSIREYIAAF